MEVKVVKQDEESWDLSGDKCKGIVDSQESTMIEIIRKEDEREKEQIVIENAKGVRTTIVINLSDGADGWVIGRGTTTFGDVGENKIKIADPRVSARHCRLFRRGSDLFVIDLGSTHGTKVNSTHISDKKERSILRGDIIHVGSSKIKIIKPASLSPGGVYEAALENRDVHELGFECPICRTSLSEMTPEARGAHINKCVDKPANSGIKPGQSDGEECPVCGKAISHLTDLQRFAHANRCVDQFNPKTKSRKPRSQPVNPKPPLSVALEKPPSISGVSKRFAFTKTTSVTEAGDLEREFESDEEIFEGDMVEKKANLLKEARELHASEFSTMVHLKAMERAQVKTETLARDIQLSPSSSDDATRRRFPAPFRPVVKLCRDLVEKKLRYFESQVVLMRELLEKMDARPGRSDSTGINSESCKHPVEPGANLLNAKLYNATRYDESDESRKEASYAVLETRASPAEICNGDGTLNLSGLRLVKPLASGQIVDPPGKSVPFDNQRESYCNVDEISARQYRSCGPIAMGNVANECANLDVVREKTIIDCEELNYSHANSDKQLHGACSADKKQCSDEEHEAASINLKHSQDIGCNDEGDGESSQNLSNNVEPKISKRQKISSEESCPTEEEDCAVARTFKLWRMLSKPPEEHEKGNVR